MKLDLATACLQDTRECVREAGLRLLADEGSEADYLLVKSMADPDTSVWQTARRVLLYRYPWLVLDPSPVRPVPPQAAGGRFGSAWSSLRAAVGRTLQGQGWTSPIVTRLRTLPGALPDVMEELKRNISDPSSLPGPDAASSSRQIMLAPTYRCNLTCSYCYAKNFGTGFPPDMSPDDLTFAMRWAAAQGVKHIILSGGEPTLYEHLGTLLEMAGAYEIAVHLTTNCIYSRQVRKLIAGPPVCELVGHYDQERMRATGAAEVFIENLGSAVETGMPVMMRYTLTQSSGPAEWRPMMDLARRLSIGQINYALAFCGSEGLNAFFDCRAAVGGEGGRIEAALQGFSADAAARGLRLHLSKPFPLCAISIETFRTLLDGEGVRAACAISRDGFTRNLTINPDLSTFPCNGIAMRGPRLTELSSIEDAGRYYSRTIRDLMLQPYHPTCTNCALWYRGFCQGACLAEQFWKSRGASLRIAEAPDGIKVAGERHA